MLPSTSAAAFASCALLLSSFATTQHIGAFTEVAQAAGVDAFQIPTMATNLCAGGAVGDFDRDGFQDFYFAAGGTEPDRLFINNGDGTFTDRAAAWGIATTHRGTGAAAADFDGDGWLDIYVTSHGPANAELPGHHKLYRNVQGRQFVNVAQAMGVHWTSNIADGWGASWGDYDLDGDLDLAVPGYRPPGGNRLFRNDGSTFTDVTVSSGLSPAIDNSFGFTVKFVDMNGDYDPELLWISDFGTSKYFVNNADGTFTDYTAQSGTALEDTEMGVALTDFDEDGDFDFFVSTVEENSLFLNQGNHTFTDVAASAGVRNSGWGWGAVAIDFNHDAKCDIVTTNWEGWEFGFLNQSSPTPDDLSFVDVGIQNGLRTPGGSGRGLSNLDYDNDGDQDILVFNWFEPIKLVRNDLPPAADRNWLRVSLDRGCRSSVPPDGIGAIVRAVTGDKTQTRLLDGGSNYLSNSELSVHFGLGDATSLDNLIVQWSDGLTTILHGVGVNQHLVVRHHQQLEPCFSGIGAGCPGAAGVPALTPRFSAVPALGTSFFVDGTNLPNNGQPAALLLGFAGYEVSLALDMFGAPGCHLHLDSPLPAWFQPTFFGQAQWQMNMPNTPAAPGLAFYLQVVTLDDTANALGIGMSNALRGIIH